MLRVAGDHAVTPEVPAGALLLDLRGRPALVAAVIPLPQVRVELDVRQPGEFRGAHGTLGRAAERGHDLAAGQRRGERGGRGLAACGEGYVGATGVPAGGAPLGLAVPEHDQL